jgi:hypothetical protein
VARPFLLVGLVARELHLLGVDHDDEVAGVHVGGVVDAALAAEKVGHLGGDTSERAIRRIDDVPTSLELQRFGAGGSHGQKVLVRSHRFGREGAVY